MTARQPVVAGQFYPGTERALRKSIEQLVVKKGDKLKAVGVVSPHAGYMYSGPVAGMVFSSVAVPETVVILGPNHTGAGLPYALYPAGSWQTPMGEAAIEETLAGKIREHSNLVAEDARAHRYEHSLEVQVPFLQYFQPRVKIVPLVIGGDNWDDYLDLGKAIAESVKSYKKDVLLVASSDMTHYEPQADAERKDKFVIEAILKLQPQEMLKRVASEDVTMCGYAPTAIMLIAAKQLEAQKAGLIKYTTSGDATGDYSSVVGYAGLAVY